MINCPGCGELASTTYSAQNLPEGRKRYVKCKNCGHHWTTMEITMDEYQRLRKLKEDNLQLDITVRKLLDEKAREADRKAARMGVTWI